MISMYKRTRHLKMQPQKLTPPTDDTDIAALDQHPNPTFSEQGGPSSFCTKASMKRYQPTHSEIEDFHLTQEQVQTFINFLRDNPRLYNKIDEYGGFARTSYMEEKILPTSAVGERRYFLPHV